MVKLYWIVVVSLNWAIMSQTTRLIEPLWTHPSPMCHPDPDRAIGHDKYLYGEMMWNGICLSKTMKPTARETQVCWLSESSKSQSLVHFFNDLPARIDWPRESKNSRRDLIILNFPLFNLKITPTWLASSNTCDLSSRRVMCWNTSLQHWHFARIPTALAKSKFTLYMPDKSILVTIRLCSMSENSSWIQFHVCFTWGFP